MNSRPATLWAFFQSIVEHRQLIWRLTKREFDARFRGHAMGTVWAVVTPLLTAAVYTFVFSTVFKAKWGTAGSTESGDFAIIFLAGLMIHGIFGESVMRAPSLIVSNAQYVTRVVFPLEILPVNVVASALVNAIIGLAVVVFGNLVLNGSLHATLLLLPIVLLPFLIFVLALVFLLSAFGTYVRDTSQLVGLLVTASLFLTPIFYSIESVPPRFQTLLKLNPLTLFVNDTRQVVLFGQLPNFAELGLSLILALLLLGLAFWLFQRLRGGFSDVV